MFLEKVDKLPCAPFFIYAPQLSCKSGVAISVRYDAPRICSLPAGEEHNIA
jgi:hypothetical protein